MLTYDELPPGPDLVSYVDCFWQLQTSPEAGRDIWLLPDGRIDVLFAQSATAPFQVVLLGLSTEASRTVLAGHTRICAVSLRLPAAEYLLREPVAGLLNTGRYLPTDFWGITPDDLINLATFARKLSATLRGLLPANPDPRKRKLFDLLYARDGSVPVQALAKGAGWSSRQINRYFQVYFGLSLKAYCGILRFRAAFPHLRAGRLFPEQPFADQAHFIREVRRLAGVRPKDLARNQDGRFIQFSV